MVLPNRKTKKAHNVVTSKKTRKEKQVARSKKTLKHTGSGITNTAKYLVGSVLKFKGSETKRIKNAINYDHIDATKKPFYDIMLEAKDLDRHRLVDKLIHCLKGGEEHGKIPLLGYVPLLRYAAFTYRKGQKWFKIGYYKIRQSLDKLEKYFFPNNNFDQSTIDLNLNLSKIEKMTRLTGSIRHQMRVLLLLCLFVCGKQVYKTVDPNIYAYLKDSIDNDKDEDDQKHFTETKIAVILYLNSYHGLSNDIKGQIDRLIHSSGGKIDKTKQHEQLETISNEIRVNDLINLLLLLLSKKYWEDTTDLQSLKQRKTLLEHIRQNMNDKVLYDIEIANLNKQIDVAKKELKISNNPKTSKPSIDEVQIIKDFFNNKINLREHANKPIGDNALCDKTNLIYLLKYLIVNNNYSLIKIINEKTYQKLEIENINNLTLIDLKYKVKIYYNDDNNDQMEDVTDYLIEELKENNKDKDNETNAQYNYLHNETGNPIR